ncbi:hypothetical protein GQ54DRAFT_22704 [Martensiomyces pterosporus]|nr:hypothetical protein GQ54DRAFT_22704 [Martensiomyces pterosporus]
MTPSKVHIMLTQSCLHSRFAAALPAADSASKCLSLLLVWVLPNFSLFFLCLSSAALAAACCGVSREDVASVVAGDCESVRPGELVLNGLFTRLFVCAGATGGDALWATGAGCAGGRMLCISTLPSFVAGSPSVRPWPGNALPFVPTVLPVSPLQQLPMVLCFYYMSGALEFPFGKREREQVACRLLTGERK